MDGVGTTEVPKDASRIHVTATFDGSKETKSYSLYVNGVLKKVGEVKADFADKGNLKIGRDFIGVIDKLRVSKTVRYTKEIEIELPLAEIYEGVALIPETADESV